MSSDTLCTHVKGIGCWRCSTLITPTLVRESGLADLDQCGKDLLVSNPYTPCDVISEGKIGSAILEEKDEVLSSGWFKVRGFKRQRLNGPAQICSPDDPVRAEKRCAIRKRRSFTKTSGPSEKATCSQATVNTQENVYRDPPATPVSVNQELHENRGIEFMIKGLNVHTIGDFYVDINDAVHISDKLSVTEACVACEEDTRFSSRDGANTNRRRDGSKDPGLVTHRLEHPDLTEAGGAREEDDKQYPSRDGAFIIKVACGAREEDEKFLSWDGAISIEKAGEAREEDARFSSRDGANTNRRRDGSKDPGLVTHRLAHPDLMEAGGAREEDDKQSPSRDGAFIMEEASSAPEEDDWLLARNGAISMEKAGGAREEDARFSPRDGANTNWRRDGPTDPGPVNHRLEHPDLLEAGGAQQEDEQLSSRTAEACEARVEDKPLSAREDANTLQRGAGLKESGPHRTTRKRPRPSSTPARSTRRNSRTVPCPALIRTWINDASIASTRPCQWNPPTTRESTPETCPSSETPTRFPRLVKKPLPEHVYPDLPGISRILTYLSKQRHHELGCGPSGHPGAGLGIWALSPLLYGAHGTRWQDNILCQYGGRSLPLEIAERDDYLSDYVIAWPEFGEAIDGQLDNTDSIGHLFNDDFYRDGGSLDAFRDPKTGKTFLCIMEDIPYGSEPSFAYGPEFWSLKLSLLSADARRACVRKYRLSDVTLASPGLTAHGHEPPDPLPRKLDQTTLDHWYETSPAPDTTKAANPSKASQVKQEDYTADHRPWAKGKLDQGDRSPGQGGTDAEGTLRGKDDSPCPAARTHAALGRASLGHGHAPGSRSLGTGELENEKALCGEDDLFCLTAVQTPTMLAEYSPPTARPWQKLAEIMTDLETATDLETQGTGPECRSLVRGVRDPEETLRSEDDSRCPLAGRTRTILAESPPPPPATRQTGSQSLALWDKGLFPVSVQSAQEPSHVGDLLGMGDLADEEALCRMNDSLPRTHPMLAVHSHLCTLWRLLLHH